MTDEKPEDALEEEIEERAPKKRSNRRKAYIWGGVVGVIVLLGVGLMVWHEDPSFCNNPICHDSMDPYVETYYTAADSVAVDKWGNDVHDSDSMMVVVHASQDVKCLDCHQPEIGQQIQEGIETVTGDYYVPLEEVDVLSLMENASRESASNKGDEFCMNDSCHSDLSREALTQRTADMSFNPHSWHHELNECSDCHKSHRASTVYCTQCHEDAKAIVPDGWVEFNEADAYEQAIYG